MRLNPFEVREVSKRTAICYTAKFIGLNPFEVREVSILKAGEAQTTNLS